MPQPYVRPYFYNLGHLYSIYKMVDLLGVADPYTLPAAEIVERLLALGCVPVLDSVRREPFRHFGTTHEVKRDGITFLVAIIRDAEMIVVQEVRTEPYYAECQIFQETKMFTPPI